MVDSIDRYSIEAVIGEGGMGRVYRALDPRLGRRVALKVLLAEGTTREARATAAARMVREARAAAAFNHPNVVAIYDVGEADGNPYIAMELVSGSSLRAYVGNPEVTAEQRLVWLLDVARGLGAAHRAGLVHRDIKPENVMITTDGVVKILDFGIARHADTAVSALASTAAASLSPLTGGGVVLGTLQYMAPEQIRLHALDGRTDQFAWGVMAYELLAGSLPWGPAPSAVSLVGAILEKPARPLSDAAPAVDANVSEAISRALAKDPASRFATMEELVAAITGREEHVVSAPRAARGASGAVRKHGSTGAITRMSITRTLALTAVRPATRVLVVLAACAAGALAIALGVRWATRSRAPAAMPAEAASAGCASNAACTSAAGGRASICNHADGACVELASEDCRLSATPEELADEGTIWFGVMLPMRPPRAAVFTTHVNGLELARSDFHLVGGLPARARDARTRPLGLLMCDDTADAGRVARHLVALGVPAVMGFGALAEALDLSTNVFVPRGILVANITSTNPLITRVAQPAGEPRLVWRPHASTTAKGEAVSRFVTDYLEPRLRGPGGPVAGQSLLRVALVRSSAANPRAFGETLVASLRMNGKPVIENGGSFRQIVYADAPSIEPSAAIGEIVAFAPHVILYSSGPAFEAAFLEPLERAWRAPHRPVYVSQEILDGPGLRAFVGRSAARRRRFFTIDLPANTEANLNFVSHYNEVYAPPITPGTAPGAPYDTFYLLAFAAASAEGDLTGLAMARGMLRVRRDGTRITVGPSGILSAFSALRAGEALALDGASSEIDLDPATGELRSDLAVYCLEEAPGGALDAVESGLRIDHRAGKITGTFHCE